MASAEFDREFKLVTSYLFPPKALAGIRLAVALYTLVVLVFLLIWEGVKELGVQSYDSPCWTRFSGTDSSLVRRFFSYFTNLSYIGICAYFWASGVQTFFYAQNEHKTYPLQQWPRFLRYLHVLLLTSVITYREPYSILNASTKL